MNTSSQCLWSSSCHSALSSVKCPSMYNSVSGFLLPFAFPGSKLHFTKCSALAFLACLLSTLLLIFVVHLAAASSRNLTFSGVLIIYFSLCAFVRCRIFLAAFSMFSCTVERSSSILPTSFITSFYNSIK